MLKRIVVIGSVNYDNFLSVPSLPVKGQTLQADSIKTGCGGKGANQAAQCGKLGVQTYFVGAVGNDLVGKKLSSTLESFGVDISHLKVVDGPSGQGYVISAKDGSVMATILRGANWEVFKEDVDAVSDLIDEETLVILQNEIQMDVVAYAIEFSHGKGAKVLLNAAPALPLDEYYLKMLDYAIFNENEAMYYCGVKFSGLQEAEKVITDFQKRIGATCIFTLGPEGAIYKDNEVFCHCPAEDVPVVETTGAGDSFIGGFAYAVTKELPVKTALKVASLCSGVTIQHVGAQESMPYLKDIVEK